MDPISQRLDHWVRFISRSATISISVYHGYHGARNSLVDFISLLGTISRTIVNLSHFGSRLEVQDILLLWALLRVLRRLLRGLVRHLGFAPPALPAWLRQLGAAPSARPFSLPLPSAPPFGPSALPSGPPSALPATQPWPLANYPQRFPLGQPTGHYPFAPVSASSAPLSAPPSGPLPGQPSGPPAPPAQTSWILQLRQQRQLQQSGPGSGGAPR
ncbi:hypothetical protein B0H65DRAFT_87007 [Neurospora tetraspora]|uniref:Uncharacterized protein n=1 Tax=Neurospora tetraspora TaxID=94610 RepID=A0AAE0MTY3_9PEZI|nr:hypothetical protein B0H65DRAFT_87007 [Neurospora tetraspora]